MIALVVRSFEGSTLVVEHRFFGETQEKAAAIYRAHLKTDAFLRGCVTAGAWTSVACRTESFWIAVV